VLLLELEIGLFQLIGENFIPSMLKLFLSLKSAFFYSNTQGEGWRVTGCANFLLYFAHVPIRDGLLGKISNNDISKSRANLLEFFKVSAVVKLKRVVQDSTIIDSCNF
jgi:hypothetical protein